MQQCMSECFHCYICCCGGGINYTLLLYIFFMPPSVSPSVSPSLSAVQRGTSYFVNAGDPFCILSGLT